MLFWIAGFMFVVGFLNKCDESKSCLSQLATMKTLILFLTWPFVVGKHVSERCSGMSISCCSHKKDQTDSKVEEEKDNSELQTNTDTD